MIIVQLSRGDIPHRTLTRLSMDDIPHRTVTRLSMGDIPHRTLTRLPMGYIPQRTITQLPMGDITISKTTATLVFVRDNPKGTITRLLTEGIPRESKHHCPRP